MSYSGHQTTSPLPLLEYTEATPLPNDESGARHTVVLVHGFPDNANVWNDTQAHLLSRGYRVVCINLPGFEFDNRPFRPLTFAETVERLYRTLQHAEALGGTVIGHDWGAIFLYRLLVAYPDAASQLVTLEIGAGAKSPLMVLFVLFYQSLIIAVSSLGLTLGSKLLAGIYRLFPRPKYNGMPKARSQHSWLYKQAWREGSSHGPWLYYYRNSIANWTPPRTLPILFLFGEDCARPLRFHTPEWRHHVTSAHPESRSIGLRGNHWFFLEHPTEFQRQLDRFLP